MSYPPNNPTTEATVRELMDLAPLGASRRRYVDRCLLAANPYGIGDEGGQIPLRTDGGAIRGPSDFQDERERRLVAGSPPAKVQRVGIDDDLGRPLTSGERAARAGRLPIDAPPPRVVVARYALEEQLADVTLTEEALTTAAAAIVRALDRHDEAQRAMTSPDVFNGIEFEVAARPARGLIPGASARYSQVVRLPAERLHPKTVEDVSGLLLSTAEILTRQAMFGAWT